ncbi:MAG: hypothetical protein AAGE80_07890 [Pseudomonadota bacterium]
MSDQVNYELDKRLEEIARQVDGRAPKPSNDLILRILADAADVSAEQVPATQPTAPATTRLPFRLEIFSVWSGGAVAVMVLGLMIGVGIGYGYGSDTIALGNFANDLALADFDEAFIGVEEPI